MGDLLDVAIARFGDPLSESGDEVRFVCPFHGGDNLYVNTTTGLWICFGGSCGRKGKLGFADEVDEIQALKMRLKRIENNEAAEPVQTYPESWLRQFQRGHPYWTGVRKFTPKTVTRFDLGYDPHTGRLTIPIRATDGQLLGAIYRSLGNERPKYLHPKGFRTGRHLFGAHMVRERTKVALVEGPLDAIACWDARVPALAVYGARLTDGQAYLLRWLGIDTVVPFFDNDMAGRRATERLKDVIPDIIVAPGNWRPLWTAKDPGELKPDQRRLYFASAGL